MSNLAPSPQARPGHPIDLDAVALAQDGLIRGGQAIAAGLPRSRIDDLVRRRVWIAVLPGVYALGVDPRAARVRVRAALLWAGDDSVLAGSAAAWWLGLTTGLPRVVEVYVPPRRSRRRQPGVRLIRSAVPELDRTTVRDLQVTTVPRTCLDLARWNRDDLLDVALRMQRMVRPELPPSLSRSRRRRGQVRARRIAAAAMDNAWSKAELLAQRVFTDGGITGWVANARAEAVEGVVIPDIAIEALMIGIEIDGRRFHDEASDPEAFERDHQRQLALARAGWFVIRVTVRQLIEEPHLVVATVRAVMAQRQATQRQATQRLATQGLATQRVATQGR